MVFDHFVILDYVFHVSLYVVVDVFTSNLNESSWCAVRTMAAFSLVIAERLKVWQLQGTVPQDFLPPAVYQTTSPGPTAKSDWWIGTREYVHKKERKTWYFWMMMEGVEISQQTTSLPLYQEIKFSTVLA